MNMRQQAQSARRYAHMLGNTPENKETRVLKTASLLSLYLVFALFVGGVYYASISNYQAPSHMAMIK